MDILTMIQIVVSILLIISILLQRSGDGIEGALGGGSSTESVRSTRRGFENLTFQVAIILGVAFTVISIMQILL